SSPSSAPPLIALGFLFLKLYADHRYLLSFPTRRSSDLINQIDSPWFGVNFDPSNAIICGEDPLEALSAVKHRVITMHASDRYLIGGTIEGFKKQDGSLGYAKNLKHGGVGKRLNDYDAIFSTLRKEGFDNWISIEDGENGMEELRESVRFLRAKIAEHFG